MPAPAPRPALTPRVGESPDDNLPFLLDEEALRRSGGGASAAAADPQQAALRRSSFSSAARPHAQPAPQQQQPAVAAAYSGRAMSASPGELRRVSFDSVRASPAGYSGGVRLLAAAVPLTSHSSEQDDAIVMCAKEAVLCSSYSFCRV